MLLRQSWQMDLQRYCSNTTLPTFPSTSWPGSYSPSKVQGLLLPSMDLVWPCYSSVTKLCPTLWNPMNSSMTGFPVLHCLPEVAKLVCIELMMPSSHLILRHPLLLLSIFPSIRVFCNESALCIRWPKYWSFIFSISPSNEYSRLISFRIDWFDRLAAQGSLKELLQNHNSKASILWCSAFLVVQFSHLYMTTGKKS